MYIQFITTQFGVMKVTATAEKLVTITKVAKIGLDVPNAITRKVAKELTAYAKCKLRKFTSISIHAGTPFEEDVWRAIASIPYGTTKSYGDIARVIGRPQAVRAVGTATGKNYLCLAIPCHRVIKSDGTHGHYAHGAKMKRELLAFEKAHSK